MSPDQLPRGGSLDVWSTGSGTQPRDVLASALCTLLLLGDGGKPAYFSSPWISDFKLFDNHFREYAALFPDLADKAEISFIDYLNNLSRRLPVRIITTHSSTSEAFIASVDARGVFNIQHRYANDEYHEKGILAPTFYIEGSMNITYSGVYVRGEKVTYHTAAYKIGAAKITAAYLEFERRWNNLG